jgi:hypothetical protein
MTSEDGDYLDKDGKRCNVQSDEAETSRNIERQKQGLPS